MQDGVVQQLKKTLTKSEIDEKTIAVDACAGGGGWALNLCEAVFHNVKDVYVNEYDWIRSYTIEVSQTLGGKRMLEIVKDLIAKNPDGTERAFFNYIAEQTIKPKKKDLYSTSPGAVAKRIRGYIEENNGLLTPEQIGSLGGFADLLGKSRLKSTGQTRADLMNTLLFENDSLVENGNRAKRIADMFKSHGGNIHYLQGDAKSLAAIKDLNGKNVVWVFDPPYYHTQGYNGQSLVPLHKTSKGWSYEDTLETISLITGQGSTIVYTDEAFWTKKEHNPHSSDFNEEMRILESIASRMRAFGLSYYIHDRTEVLGISNGRKTESTAKGLQLGPMGRTKSDVNSILDERFSAGGQRESRTPVLGVAG